MNEDNTITEYNLPIRVPQTSIPATPGAAGNECLSGLAATDRVAQQTHGKRKTEGGNRQRSIVILATPVAIAPSVAVARSCKCGASRQRSDDQRSQKYSI